MQIYHNPNYCFMAELVLQFDHVGHSRFHGRFVLLLNRWYKGHAKWMETQPISTKIVLCFILSWLLGKYTQSLHIIWQIIDTYQRWIMETVKCCYLPFSYDFREQIYSHCTFTSYLCLHFYFKGYWFTVDVCMFLCFAFFNSGNLS